MDADVREAVAGGEAYVVGGAIRDELLGRPLLDLDVACRRPEEAAHAYRSRAGGAVFLLSHRHGAWRVALPAGRTVDFTLLRGSIGDDLAGRDFTANAIAIPVAGGNPVDPFGGRDDLAARVLRAVSERVFADDPLRLLRAVRLEDELGLRLDPATERLVHVHAARVAEPAGERILAELLRLSPAGYRRLDELGLLSPLGGSTERLDRVGPDPGPELLLVTVLGEAVTRLPIANETRRLARTLLRASRPRDGSPREIHRFRRATEPWAVEALFVLGAPELAPAVESSRAADPAEPLVRGDELGVPPGPEIGRLLGRIDEERAAGTIRTRDEALELVRRELSHEDVTQARFAATADRLAALGSERIERTRERLRRLLEPRGDERALDVGTGTGTLALALAPLVREVVGLDLVPAMLDRARRDAGGFPNVSFVEGDVARLPFEAASFDLVLTSRTIHHVRWPEIAVAGMARVCRTRGRLLVVDQVTAVDPLDALAHNRLEHLRDPSHVRVLSDQDFRSLFDANGLALRRVETERDELELGHYLDLAACEGDARAAVYAEVERLLALGQTAGLGLRHAPEGYRISLSVAWYLLEKTPPTAATTAA